MSSYGGPFFTAALFKLLQDILAFAQPQLLKRYVCCLWGFDERITDSSWRAFAGSFNSLRLTAPRLPSQLTTVTSSRSLCLLAPSRKPCSSTATSLASSKLGEFPPSSSHTSRPLTQSSSSQNAGPCWSRFTHLQEVLGTFER